MLPPFTVQNALLHLFQSISLLNLWRSLLLLSCLALTTSYITRSTEFPRDHSFDQPLPIFFLASMNLNFSRPLPSWRCILLRMTLSKFSSEDECDLFLHNLNSLHPYLRFNFEKESNLDDSPSSSLKQSFALEWA